MEGDPKAAVEAVEQDRNPRNRGIGLCLSGGGFRATLFHLGAIQRLFELGIATSPGFDTVASVPQGQASRSPAAASPARSGPSPKLKRKPRIETSTSRATSHAQS